MKKINYLFYILLTILTLFALCKNSRLFISKQLKFKQIISNNNISNRSLNENISYEDQISLKQKLCSNSNLNNSSISSLNIEKKCEEYNHYLNLCNKCIKGYFLLNNECLEVCPKDTISNLSLRKCTELNSNSYLFQYNKKKAFSTNSCNNYCGKAHEDCSCKIDCLENKNCCSDIGDRCLNIFNFIKKNNTQYDNNCKLAIPNCDFCSNLNLLKSSNNLLLSKVNDNTTYFNPDLKCIQCSNDYFLRDNKCVNQCPIGELIVKNNKICLENKNCETENCIKCSTGVNEISILNNGNNSKYNCQECNNGYFKYKNQCLEKCPHALLADRISKTCVYPPVEAFYYIYPSRSSCRNNCNKNRFINDQNDCRCDLDCKRNASCCYDINEYCKDNNNDI